MTQSKLEPICRALANVAWPLEIEIMQQEGEKILIREEYTDQCWALYLTDARAVVQALIEMSDPPIEEYAADLENTSLASRWLRMYFTQEWLRSLLQDSE